MKSWFVTAAAAVAVSFADATATGPFVQDLGWPQGMPAKATQLSAVGVDPFALGGAEVYIAQRGPNLTEPILVFNEKGELLRSWGSDHVARDASSGSWGCHGLSVKSSPTSPTEIWINDFVSFTTKVFSPSGDLLLSLGTPNVGGDDDAPIQFDKVADTAFGPNTVFISDGDGSSNHRVVALDGDKLNKRMYQRKKMIRGSRDSPASHVKWIGGNNNTHGAFGASVEGLSLQSMHSVAHHKRTNTLFAIDRENNRTLHVDAETGAVQGLWTVEDMLPAAKTQGGFETVYGVRTFYSAKYNKDLVVFALGDMDAADAVPHQGVLVLDGSGVSAAGPGPVKTPLQTIEVDSSQCWTPHLLGMNDVNGDLYVACVGKNSAVWRYTYQTAE